jgi:hypothetical protein
MKTVALMVTVILLAGGCSKQKEKALKIGGVWEETETIVTTYADNEPAGDSLVEQSGLLLFSVSDGLDNSCSHTLDFAPMIDVCNWDIPRKQMNQLFFYYHDENSLSIYSSSCMIGKLTNKKLELVQIGYDNDLNIQQKIVWKFRRKEL